jgi:hypothetical protein
LVPHLPFPEINKHLPRYPLHVHIGVLFSLLIVIAGATLGWHNYIQNSRLVRTDPYIFFTTRELGVTFSYRGANGHSVVGVDATLEDVSRLLLSHKVTPSSRMVWFDRNEQVITFDQPEQRIQRAVDNGQGELRLPKVGGMGGADS